MGGLKQVWPDDQRGAFGPVFDDFAATAEYGRDIVLRFPETAAVLGNAGLDAWFAAHRPPARWKGTVSGIAQLGGGCAADCAACARWWDALTPEQRVTAERARDDARAELERPLEPEPEPLELPRPRAAVVDVAPPAPRVPVRPSASPFGRLIE